MVAGKALTMAVLAANSGVDGDQFTVSEPTPVEYRLGTDEIPSLPGPEKDAPETPEEIYAAIVPEDVAGRFIAWLRTHAKERPSIDPPSEFVTPPATIPSSPQEIPRRTFPNRPRPADFQRVGPAPSQGNRPRPKGLKGAQGGHRMH